MTEGIENSDGYNFSLFSPDIKKFEVFLKGLKDKTLDMWNQITKFQLSLNNTFTETFRNKVNNATIDGINTHIDFVSKVISQNTLYNTEKCYHNKNVVFQGNDLAYYNTLKEKLLPLLYPLPELQ